jgi:hypothetical protein
MGLVCKDGGARLVRALRGIAFAAIGAAWISIGGAAQALPIAPFYFGGPGGFGLAPGTVEGLPVAAVASPESRWLLAGGRAVLTQPGLVIDNRLTQVHANPQGAGDTPSAANPLVADSTWTVTNETGAPLDAGFLVFTTIDVDRRYPGLQAGLDGALLQIVEYSFAGTDYVFGAMELPSLGVGQSVDLTIRYVVAGPLDYDAETNAYVLPRLGVAGLLVPEPVSALAIGLGLAALGAWRRVRRSSHSA